MYKDTLRRPAMKAQEKVTLFKEKEGWKLYCLARQEEIVKGIEKFPDIVEAMQTGLQELATNQGVTSGDVLVRFTYNFDEMCPSGNMKQADAQFFKRYDHYENVSTCGILSICISEKAMCQLQGRPFLKA